MIKNICVMYYFREKNFDYSNFKYKTKKYDLPLNEFSKIRIHLLENLDAFIYFYPDGFENNSRTGYIASHIQLRILDENSQHCINENLIFDVKWKLGRFKQTQTLSIKRYFKDYHIALGINNLFKKQQLIKNNQRIKVNYRIYHKLYINEKGPKNKIKKKIANTKRNLNNNNNNNNNSKRQTKIEKYTLINLFDNDKRIIKQRLDKFVYKDEYKFPHLNDVLIKFSEKLDLDDLFSIIPTIDCFTDNKLKNYQSICKHYITKEMNFFNTEYDDSIYWENHIAWCFPPTYFVSKCLYKFRLRKMKGYICVYNNCNLVANLQRYCIDYVVIKGRDVSKDYLIPENQVKCSPFHINVYYFDFQLNQKQQ